MIQQQTKMKISLLRMVPNRRPLGRSRLQGFSRPLQPGSQQKQGNTNKQNKNKNKKWNKIENRLLLDFVRSYFIYIIYII